MNASLYLADTHALYWFESHHPQLTEAVIDVFRQAEQGSATIILSPIALAEFYYLLCKLNLESHFPTYLQFLQHNRAYRFEPVLWQDVQALPSFSEISEMHDRLLAIQAKRLGATLISKDPVLRASKQVQCIW